MKRHRAQYAQLEAGARPEELAQARDQVRKAHAALENAKRTLDRTQELVDRAFVPPQELPEHRLKPGMFAHVSLIVKTYRNVLLVPKVAVIRDEAGEKVFIRNERLAHARPVQTGFATDDWVIVLDRVQAGEEVVVAGQEHLTDGAPVIVVGDGGGAEGNKR